MTHIYPCKLHSGPLPTFSAHSSGFEIGHVCDASSPYSHREFDQTTPSTRIDWMNDIQRIPAEKHGHLFVTLNPPSEPSPKHVLGHYSYFHPVQTTAAVRAQGRIVQLNASATAKGRHRAFAGAWTGYGFHEHGFTAGLRAAAALPGVKLPFRIADADAECGVPRAGVVARVFDVLDVLRAYVIFIIGGVLLFVVWPVGKNGT